MARRTLLCLFLTLLLCPSAMAAEDLDSLWAAWAERDEPGALDRAIDAYGAYRGRQDPVSCERLLRAWNFRATQRYAPHSSEVRRELGEAVKQGLACLSRAPYRAGRPPLRDPADLDGELSLVPRQWAGVLFWITMCYGPTIEQLSLWRQPGAARRFKRMTERCAALDEGYFHAGPHRVLTGYLAQAPRIMGGDTALARSHAEAMLRLAPGFGWNYISRAENIWGPARDRARYAADLRAALELGDDAARDALPEQRAARAAAQKMQRQ